MFSFHKPKIYRSIQGCCICRAKSSSSRFTDSKRYELDFCKCFQIMERRAGEICNACVLLVKRWKKLPAGSNRNWHHVVDARAGPGTKSMNKIKNKAKMEEKLLKKKHKHKHKKPKMIVKPPQSPGGLSDDIIDDCLSDRSSHSGYLTSDDESSSRKSSSKRRKNSNPLRFSSFLDLTYWKKTEICCGIIFKGANGEVIIDPSLLRPCICRAKSAQSQAAPTPITRQDSAECMEGDACDSGIGSQETSPDTSPPDSQPLTPLDPEPPTHLAMVAAPLPTMAAISGPSWLDDHTIDEVATATAVLDLSVPKLANSLPTSTPSSRQSPSVEDISALEPDLAMPILEQHTPRCIEMEV